jgi:hypothetical protein
VWETSELLSAEPVDEDGNSALMLVATLLRHIGGTRWGTRRYLNMDLLKELKKGEVAA